MRCQCLERGCIHGVFLRVGRWKTVSVISNSCSAHFIKRKSPLLLHFPTPSDPITPSQVWWSVPTLALKSPRRMSLSVRGCCRNHRIQIIIEPVFNLIWVDHYEYIGTYNCCMPLPDKGSLSVIRRSFMPFGSPGRLLTRCDLMANPTPALRRSFSLRSLQKKV